WGSDGSITVQAASVLETDAIAALTPVSLNQGEGRRPVLAVSSSIALLLWEDSLQGTLRFARWDKLGGLLDPGGVPLSVGIAPSNLAVTTTSLGFLAAWTEQPAAGTRRVRVGFWDASGNHVITHAPLTAWGELNSNPTLAAGGSHAVVVWHTPGADGGDLVQQQLDASGYPVGAPTTLTTGLGLQMIPKVYGEGSQYDLLWTHQDGGGRSLKWAVMDSVGALTPSGGYEITPPSEFAADGAVTRLGNACLVAYRVPDATDSDDLRFRSWMGPVPAAVDTALVLVAAETTGIHEEELALAGPRAWPNPFRHATRVPGHHLEVFDIRGARVRFLKGSGGFLSWDGRDERGLVVPNGVYLLRSQGFGHTVRVVKVP
ncbi:MAG: hypothetical protein HKN21_10790, partial [Candidatus Eisenbacteria bacterium]|nr:hypothetical protein [Candidatus Eisenbacteria bacterium]